MTPTPAGRPTTPAGHERPCWCQACLGITLWELHDACAIMLDAALRERAYVPGFERELAAELIHGIPSDRRNAALEMLVYDHLSPRVHSVDCLLDETDERSYAAVSEMSDILLAAIHAQDDAPGALRVLVVNEICKRQELLADDRRVMAERACAQQLQQP